MLALLYVARSHSTHMNMPTVCPPHLVGRVMEEKKEEEGEDKHVTE